MVKTIYKMSKLIKKYYVVWINSPTLIEHPLDRRMFFQFIKACIRYSRRDVYGGWLKYFLRKDLSDKYTDEYREELISEVVVLFEHILDFVKTSFPDHVLEMRNPYAVYSQLKYYGYSDIKINDILKENFKKSWLEEYI